jgi:hypothetical protein
MERFVDQNWLLNQYPHGWTSMEDVEHFTEDMEYLYFRLFEARARLVENQ